MTFEGDGVHPQRLHRNHQIEIRALNVTMPIGQLLVYGSNDCGKFLLLPKDRQLPKDLAAVLKSKQIDLLHFRLNNRGVRILRERTAKYFAFPPRLFYEAAAAAILLNR